VSPPTPAATEAAPRSEDLGVPPDESPIPDEVTARPPSSGWWAARGVPLLWFLLIAAVTVAVHLLAALRLGAPVATLGEARLAVATVVVRGAEIIGGPLPFGDRVAAVQLAVPQLLMPLADASIVDAARWSCLVLGAVSALLLWPVLRRLGVSAPASAVGMGLLGASLPAVALHAGISAGVPAVTWLLIAAAFAVRLWGKAAIVAALIATVTAPLVGAGLLALAAHLVLGRTVRVPDNMRLPIGGLLGLAAVAAAALAVGDGPLAGTAGPLSRTSIAVVGVVAGLVVLALAWHAADWLRPVWTAAALVLVAALAPGPSRTTAALLAAPALAVAVGLIIDRVAERLSGRTMKAGEALALLLVLVGPAPLVLNDREPPPVGNGLVSWLLTEPVPGTAVRADELDRAELLFAGFPAAQLRGPGDAVESGELLLASDRPNDGRPGSGPTSCVGRSAVATVVRGTGGAPGAVCRTDGGAEAVIAEGANRTRLGSALAENPALRLSPAAAEALRAGAVDPRLMLVLAAMTTAHQVVVDDFPVAELDTPDVPRRRALLSMVDGIPTASSDLLRTWLTAQQPPFQPSSIRPEGSALLVGYPAPPVAGLLPD
jgi:hypothetical protein